MSGTTAIAAVFKGAQFTVANIGDSRAVVGEKKGRRVIAYSLSIDQTPYRQDERERVKASGAVVMSCDQLEGIVPYVPLHTNLCLCFDRFAAWCATGTTRIGALIWGKNSTMEATHRVFGRLENPFPAVRSRARLATQSRRALELLQSLSYSARNSQKRTNLSSWCAILIVPTLSMHLASQDSYEQKGSSLPCVPR